MGQAWLAYTWSSWLLMAHPGATGHIGHMGRMPVHSQSHFNVDSLLLGMDLDYVYITDIALYSNIRNLGHFAPLFLQYVSQN